MADLLYNLTDEQPTEGRFEFTLDFEGFIPDGDVIDDVDVTVTDKAGNNVTVSVFESATIDETEITVVYVTPATDNDLLIVLEVTSLALAHAKQSALIHVTNPGVFV